MINYDMLWLMTIVLFFSGHWCFHSNPWDEIQRAKWWGEL